MYNRNYSPMGIFTRYHAAGKALRDIVRFKTGKEHNGIFDILLRCLTGDPIGTYRHQRIVVRQLLPDLIYKAIMGCEQSLEEAKRLVKLDEDYHYVTTVNYAPDGKPIYTSVPRHDLLRLTA